MKKFYLFTLLFSVLSLSTSYAQDGSHNWTVQLSAEANADPATITLKWLPNAVGGETYFIWKKEKNSVGWGTSIATVSAAATLEWTDTNVVLGRSYEYMVQLRTGGSVNAWSYINSGVEVSLDPNKGDLLLLIDERHADGLAPEIALLEQDMYTDGWMVTTAVIDSTSTPEEVKTEILEAYNSLDNLVGLYLLGHIAVPYSGDLYPDYVFNHKGAWPADLYYADMFGEWTDTEVNTTSASDSRNHNIPGDGKFDQSKVPSTVNLQMSRVDFFELGVYAASEEDLLRNYLNKAHEFKMAEYIPVERGMFDQGDLYFYSEGFAQNAIRNFTAFFGPDSTQELDYWTTLNSGESYLWSYGSGNGSYGSIGGLNGDGAPLSTYTVATGSNASTFTMLYGNYFGDWDNSNNIMRTMVAGGKTLACSWAGRPNWHYHHMAMGENIGYSARVSQDLFSDYFSLTLDGGALVTFEGVHVAQLGDPTLRMYYVAPPTDVEVMRDAENAMISWTASTDAEIDGYNVYRRLETGLWTKVNDEIITETSFTDATVPDAGAYLYMVKATKLKTNGSGTFYNESHGREGSIEFFSGVTDQIAVDLRVYPNPNNGNFNVVANQPIDDLRIYLADGQLVYNAQPKVNQVNLTLEELSKGVYMLELKINGESHVERLVLK